MHSKRLQESLASSFEGVNLFEDALWQYDELEASFYQVLKEKNLSWFGTLITPQAKDDSLPLLSINKKPYRDLILANTISVFDFRIYLLSRQCALLAKMGRIVEVGKKATAFLGAFGRRLKEVEVGAFYKGIDFLKTHIMIRREHSQSISWNRGHTRLL